MKMFWLIKDSEHALIMIERYMPHDYVFWKRYDDNIWHDAQTVQNPEEKGHDSCDQLVDRLKSYGYKEITLRRAIFNETIFGGEFFKGFRYHIRKRIADHVEREFNQSKNRSLSMCEL